jgi:FkbM family methyltransferase
MKGTAMLRSELANVDEFRADLIRGIYQHIYQKFVEDNFDVQRFSYDGVDRSGVLNTQGNANYLNFLLANLDSFFAASLLFNDQASRDLFRQLIKYRCLGHPHLRIREDMTWSEIKSMIDRAKTYEVGPSQIPFSGAFGALAHHEGIPTEERPISLDVWNVNLAYGLGRGDHRQYYFSRDGVRIQPAEGDYLIDGGACFGDTSIFFSCSAGPSGRVFAFEPLPEHINAIVHNIDQNLFEDRVFVVPTGLGEFTNQVQTIDSSLSKVANPGFSISNREDAVPVLAIDDFLSLQKIEKMDFIKMDVEGFELKALKGASSTIAKFRPKLAISLYHKPEDFFEIPICLKSYYPFYRLYLDHYTIHAEETVLYAIADPVYPCR